MINRKLKEKLIEAAKGFPIISVIGPRQSGKTTLAKMTFPDYEYVSLEKTKQTEEKNKIIEIKIFFFILLILSKISFSLE